MLGSPDLVRVEVRWWYVHTGEYPDKIQSGLNTLDDFCCWWNLIANYDKTEILIFKNTKPPTPPLFVYRGSELRHTGRFKYLGIMFDCEGKCDICIETLCGQARKTTMALHQRFQAYEFAWHEKYSLYQQLMELTLSYRLQVWGYERAPDMEILHRNNFKTLTQFRLHSNNLAMVRDAWRGVTIKNRLCTNCHLIDDEVHVISEGKLLEGLRRKYLTEYTRQSRNTVNTINLLRTEDCRIINNLCIFIKKGWKSMTTELKTCSSLLLPHNGRYHGTPPVVLVQSVWFWHVLFTYACGILLVETVILSI